MKRLHRVLLVLATAVALTGCDGHIASLLVHDRSGPPAPFLMTVVENDSGADAPTVVAEVAHSLDLPAMEGYPNHYGKRLANGHGFGMYVALSDRPGVWHITLLDWPATQRSEISRHAEEMLRSRLSGLKPSSQ